jgi:Aldo/keto reductase family
MLIAGNEIDGIGLGTAQFAFRDRTAEDSVATVHAALDAGMRLIDTALAYTRPDVQLGIIARARGRLVDLCQPGLRHGPPGGRQPPRLGYFPRRVVRLGDQPVLNRPLVQAPQRGQRVLAGRGGQQHMVTRPQPAAAPQRGWVTM